MDKNITEMPVLRDVRGKANQRISAPRGSVEAFMSWELLQRGVVHNTKKLSTFELEELCGCDSRWIRYLTENALSSTESYNHLNG